METSLASKLSSLYNDGTKHSNYQNVPEFVENELGYHEEIDEGWRGDTARLNFFLQSIEFSKTRSIGDIGANTGFFSLTLAHRYPNINITAFEANESHVDYMRIIKEHFDLEKFLIQDVFVDLKYLEKIKFHDILFFLNVLHHAGYDYDQKHSISNSDFRQYAIKYLYALHKVSSMLVFQMGYNWGGDKNKPIVSPHDILGMIRLLSHIFLASNWEIETIAFATRNDTNLIEYIDMPRVYVEHIIQGQFEVVSEQVDQYISSLHIDQFPGEFYRRPIVICSSRRNFKEGNSGV